jgi:hypothetical protein
MYSCYSYTEAKERSPCLLCATALQAYHFVKGYRVIITTTHSYSTGRVGNSRAIKKISQEGRACKVGSHYRYVHAQLKVSPRSGLRN